MNTYATHTRRRIGRSAFAIAFVAIAASASTLVDSGHASALGRSTTHVKLLPRNQTVGNPEVLQATVGGHPAATGMVQFYEDTTPLGGAVEVTNRVATLTDTFDLGSHTVSAQYLGDTKLAPSTSAPVTFLVGEPSDTRSDLQYHSIPPMPVSAWSASTPVLLVTNIGVVAKQTNYGARTGTATVRIDGTTNYVVTVTKNRVVLELPNGFGSVGAHTAVATYHGDSHYNPSSAITRRIAITHP
ncbi:MAG TPA: Ig-like domain-containing protein [Acidimicrobiia bacterium]|jgi:hypothetical protein